jgi:hypothetical protein
MMSMRQTMFLSCVAVVASQYNYQQFWHGGETNQHGQVSHSGQAATEQQNDWHQYLPESARSNQQQHDWHKYVGSGDDAHRNNEWHHYVYMRNGSIDWHRYEHLRNTTEQDMTPLPGNFSGDASGATTEDELKIWRERAHMQIHSFVPKAEQNQSLANVDAEYQRNLDRISSPAAATEAPAVAPTEAPAAVAAAVVVTEAPVVVTNLSESTLRQASPALLMFALLAGVAVSAVAVGRRHRRASSSSEPLLTEHTIMVMP